MSINLTNEQLDRIRSIENLEAIESLQALRSSDTYILAEGDSWFAYPRKGLIFGKDANIVHHLEDYPNLKITEIASNGDEAVHMMTGEAKLDFLDRASSGKYNIILFSGGGNDIVGRYDFEFFLKQKLPTMSWEDCIEKERLNRRLQMIRNAYIDLIELVTLACNKSGVSVPPIISHTYDLAIPIPDGASFVWGLFKVDGGRSWMHPYLENAGITDKDDQKNIVHYILNNFGDMLMSLDNEYPENRFKVVDTRGTITEDDWLNEIHPTSEGFGKIAKRIFDEAINPIITNQ